jgi:hypothetical protein
LLKNNENEKGLPHGGPFFYKNRRFRNMTDKITVLSTALRGISVWHQYLILIKIRTIHERSFDEIFSCIKYPTIGSGICR